jgi:ribose transport system permease protein
MSSFAWRLLGVLLLCVVLTLSSSAFLTVGNLLNVLRQASLIFLIAAGLTFVILLRGSGSVHWGKPRLSACLAAAAIKATGSISIGIAAGVACGTTIAFSMAC